MSARRHALITLASLIVAGCWVGLGAAAVLNFSGERPLAPAVLLAMEVLGVPVGVLLGIAWKRKPVRVTSLISYKDDLTGMPNRSSFMERLDEALARAVRQRKLVAVLLLDLDRFKLINDTFGHEAGDHILAEVGRRFRRQIRSGEGLARLGGDEFGVVLEGLEGARGGEATAERLLGCLDPAFSIDGHEVAITVSIGMALGDEQPCPAGELLRRADVALYQAKAAGRNCSRIFQAAKGTSSLDHLELDAGLRKALQQNELCLYYQPEVDLSSGRIVGLEALIRWHHPQRGLLLPGAFMQSAEDSGLTNSMGRWVLYEACRKARDWQTLPQAKDMTVSVNVSPAEFKDREFVDQIVRVLDKTGLEPERLRLEILETALMSESDSTIQILLALKRLGVKLAIDDFGTGYSSLNYLRRFPTDTVKIDRSFVIGSEKSHQAGSIIQAIVSLAHALDMDVTAEGVETRDQLSLLLDAHCDYAQGFLFSRPLPEDAVPPFLVANQAEVGASATLAA